MKSVSVAAAMPPCTGNSELRSPLYSATWEYERVLQASSFGKGRARRFLEPKDSQIDLMRRKEFFFGAITFYLVGVKVGVSHHQNIKVFS